MKTENYQHKTIHQRVEELLRHRAGLTMVVFFMVIGASSFDGRFRHLLQEVYAQGWGWVGTYMHHEHPMHYHNTINLGRLPTTSGPN
jgi:hypothetical protein